MAGGIPLNSVLAVSGWLVVLVLLYFNHQNSEIKLTEIANSIKANAGAAASAATAVTAAANGLSSNVADLQSSIDKVDSTASETLKLVRSLAAAGASKTQVQVVERAAPAPPVQISSVGNPLKLIPNEDNAFRAVGAKHVTDKVGHGYHRVYEKYLKYIRNEPIRMLEIGLGCNMPYGPGHSIPVWKEYFPNLKDLYVVDYVASCAKPFADKVSELFVGDQSDIPFMTSIGKKVGPFDIVVDDGGHAASHMRHTFEAMLPYVKPGGLLFMEDLSCAYVDGYTDMGKDTMTTLTQEILDVKHDTLKKKPHSKLAEKLAALIEYVECWPEICVFVRNNQPAAV